MMVYLKALLLHTLHMETTLSVVDSSFRLCVERMDGHTYQLYIYYRFDVCVCYELVVSALSFLILQIAVVAVVVVTVEVLLPLLEWCAV